LLKLLFRFLLVWAKFPVIETLKSASRQSGGCGQAQRRARWAWMAPENSNSERLFNTFENDVRHAVVVGKTFIQGG
jgi:hypothetical protein